MLKFSIKTILLCASVASMGAAHVAYAAYPDRPVTITVPFPAGGGVDVVGRLYAQEITQVTGREPAAWEVNFYPTDTNPGIIEIILRSGAKN